MAFESVDPKASNPLALLVAEEDWAFHVEAGVAKFHAERQPDLELGVVMFPGALRVLRRVEV